MCGQKLFALWHLKLSPHPQRARVGARTQLCCMPSRPDGQRVSLQTHFIGTQEYLRAGRALHHLCLASFTFIGFSCSWLSTRFQHKYTSFVQSHRLRAPAPRVVLSLRNPAWKVLLKLRSSGLLAGKKGDPGLNTTSSSRAKFTASETQRLSGKLNTAHVWSVKLGVTGHLQLFLKGFLNDAD